MFKKDDDMESKQENLISVLFPTLRSN